MQVLGVDGWKKKWVGVELNDGVLSSIRIFESLKEVVANKQYAVIAIDVPIGLPEIPPRSADTIVRKNIGGRASAVFASPPAFCLERDWSSRKELSDECKKRFGIGIGSHTFSLLQNIRQAHEIAKCDERVYETHPEYTFCVMNESRPLEFTKKAWNGVIERKRLLKRNGIVLPEPIEGEAGRVSVDDLLDAASCAWTANRIGKNCGVAVPDTSQRMERIWA